MRINSIVSKFLIISLGKLFFLALVASCSCVVFADPTKVLNVEQKLQSMTTEEKVGQLFIFGVRGTQMNPKLEKRLNDFRPGAVIFFKRNITSLGNLQNFISDLQSHSKLPLFTMLDQEGGSVSRLPLDFTPPSAWSLAKLKKPEFSQQVGATTGELLKSVGINFNLSPVYDLSPKKGSSFLGTRVFSADSKLISAHANAFSIGLHSAKVIPTAKHFPGHGLANGDSHKMLPESSTLQELESFKSFFNLNNAPTSVMMAHVSYPRLDSSGLPASLSEKIVTGLLRKKLNYSGLVITDDIEMIGVKSVAPIGEKAVQAFEAGCDMIMVT